MAKKQNETPKESSSPKAGTAKQREEYLKKLNGLIAEAEEKLTETLGELSEKADDIKGIAEYQMKESLEEAEKHIREKPLSSVAIAAGVGFVIGLLLNRRG